MTEPVSDIRCKDDERRLAASLAAQGLTYVQIANRLGVTPRTVHRYLAHQKLTTAPAPPLSEQERARSQQMLEDGASYAEVARTLGRTATTIARHFPGHALDRYQIAERATFGRQRARLGI